jgi:hypothetical protein
MAADVLACIRGVLRVVEDESLSALDSIEALEAALDQLAACVHAVGFEFDDGQYQEPPTKDPAVRYQQVAERYPAFGLYNTPLDISEKAGATELAVGDAVSDLAEICEDLEEVLWRFGHTSEADALFHFQLGYRSHWGRHLRELQLYVHDLHW